MNCTNKDCNKKAKWRVKPSGSVCEEHLNEFVHYGKVKIKGNKKPKMHSLDHFHSRGVKNKLN